MTVAVRIGNDRTSLRVQSVGVTQSLENALSQAQIVTYEQNRFALAQLIEVDIDGVRRFTGTLEEHPGVAHRGYQLSCQSTTGNLQRFQADKNEVFRRTTAGNIVSELCSRVDVAVVGTSTSSVGKHSLRAGTSYMTSAQKLGEAHGFTLTVDGFGRAVMFALPDVLTPVGTWTRGVPPVRDIEIDPSLVGWVDEFVLRGERSPVSSDVTNPVGGQLGMEVVTGSIRRSRELLSNRAASNAAAARTVVLQEARKRLAQAFRIPVQLGSTDRSVGDLVQVRIREGKDQLNMTLIISSLDWSIESSNRSVTAICRLPDVYGSGELSRAAISEVST